jgi:UDP-N-acetylmuramyl pentapeptide phosphotransferase/UDP-N-acetylglucosamine-1-phosphate transferase
MNNNKPLFSLLVIFIGYILTFGLTGWVCRLLIKRSLLDIPNDRSSHKMPVPRGGGLALLVLLIPAAFGAIWMIDGNTQHTGLVLALVLLAAVSWADDTRHINPGVRLGVHLLAAYLGTLSFMSNETIFQGVLPLWLDRAFTVIAWAWFINLYNFMDGIDGITASESIAIALGVSLIMIVADIADPYAVFLSLVLMGQCLGFLTHNWHPAKIFLGDVGSVPLGYMTGFLLVTLAVRGYPAAAVILPLYYLVDSGVTLIRRIARGEKPWKAHREHFYQIAAQHAGCHDSVVYRIMAANIFLIVAALVSVKHPWSALAIAFLIIAILLIKMHKIKPKIVKGDSQPL